MESKEINEDATNETSELLSSQASASTKSGSKLNKKFISFVKSSVLKDKEEVNEKRLDEEDDEDDIEEMATVVKSKVNIGKGTSRIAKFAGSLVQKLSVTKNMASDCESHRTSRPPSKEDVSSEGEFYSMSSSSASGTTTGPSSPNIRTVKVSSCSVTTKSDERDISLEVIPSLDRTQILNTDTDSAVEPLQGTFPDRESALVKSEKITTFSEAEELTTTGGHASVVAHLTVAESVDTSDAAQEDSVDKKDGIMKTTWNFLTHPFRNEKSKSEGSKKRVLKKRSLKLTKTPFTSHTDDKEEHLFKVLVIGEHGVGKTSIIERFVREENGSSTNTNFVLKTITWDGRRTVLLQLWNSSVADRNEDQELTPLFYNDASGALIVFDVTREVTFKEVTKWRKELNFEVSDITIPCVLLANKCDRQKERLRNDSTMEKYCAEQGFITWFLTSANHDINIENAFNSLIIEMLLKTKQED